MPADEGFYRKQKKLHVVFLATSLAMLGATIWMMAVDHYHPWKKYQREFYVWRRELADEHLREYEKANQANRDKELGKLDKELENQLAIFQGHYDELAVLKADLSGLRLESKIKQQEAQFTKADRQEYASQYDQIIAQLSETDVESSRWKRLKQEKEDTEKRLDAQEAKLAEAEETSEQAKEKVKATEKKIEDIEKAKKEIQDKQEKLRSQQDKLQKTFDDAQYTFGAQMRALPIIDGFASPVKVKQTIHEKLPLDYNFMMVDRFDRCMTCHLGIDKKGYTTIGDKEVLEPFRSHPNLEELFVSEKSSHPVTKFGCTICHQGQGSSVSFDWASHTPANLEQMDDWKSKYGWFFDHFHQLPMLPHRFIESSCLKCHHDPHQIPEAKKVLRGYQTVGRYGCFGCHEIQGYKDGRSVGPNLRIASANDSPEDRARALRKVGPSLLHVAKKLTPEFMAKWIRNPLAFRPTTRMPQFYHQLDGGEEGWYDSKAPSPKAGEFQNPHELNDLGYTEIQAITAYLLAKSVDVELPVVAETGNPERGRDLFRQKGCLACHSHKEFEEQWKEMDIERFGPDLSEISQKFTTQEQKSWLKSWIKDPAAYNSKTYMPKLKLDDDPEIADRMVADLASYLLSVPGKWDQEITIPLLDETTLQDMVIMYRSQGRSKKVVAQEVEAMSQTEKLLFLGERTIARLGCFGCHEISGFENSKPIGTSLADWGRKDPHKITFENIVEYVNTDEDSDKFYDNGKNDYFRWALEHGQREGFLMQKLREPRSYDYKKIRRWVDRARMPKFAFTDEQREAVATFVLGLTGEEIDPEYVYSPSAAKQAVDRGHALLHKYNCIACHVIEPGEYRYTPDEDQRDFLRSTASKKEPKYYSSMFPGPSPWSALSEQEKAKIAEDVRKGEIDFENQEVFLRGLAYTEDPEEAEDPEDLLTSIQLWEPTWFWDDESKVVQDIPAGEKVTMIPESQLEANPAHGGRFAEMLVEHLITTSPNPADAAARENAWARVPPPLIREGEKVQTPWLYRFLRDPVSIRPAVVLRMPRFNYRQGDVEALADFFAAHDGAPYPYFPIPERESNYIAEHELDHSDYLVDGLKLMTVPTSNKVEPDPAGPVTKSVGLCVNCHPVGGIKPTGEKPETFGPLLSRAPERLRPEWMLQYISNPKRLVPYTGMPVNFPEDLKQFQDLFEGSNADQIQAVRDSLINYPKVVDQVLEDDNLQEILKRQRKIATSAEAQPKAEGEE